MSHDLQKQKKDAKYKRTIFQTPASVVDGSSLASNTHQQIFTVEQRVISHPSYSEATWAMREQFNVVVVLFR